MINYFVVMFGINIMSDISKVKFKTILKYHKWYLCQISRTNHAINLFVYTTTRKRFVIFTGWYFKLTWNTTALLATHIAEMSHVVV